MMNCDLCHAQIILNRQAIVIEEEETKQPGTTLVTFMAHRTCYDPPQPAGGFNPERGRVIFEGNSFTSNPFTWRTS